MTALLPSVLIIDDDRSVAEAIGVMADSLGAQAKVSHSAEEFFREWKLSAADVAIIDLQMPGRDGLDVIRQLGEIGRAQVVLCSGCGPRILEAARHAARNNGLNVVGVLPKPIRRNALKKILEAVQIRGEIQDSQVSLDKSSLCDVDALHAALSDKQIIPFFQPILRLRDRTIHGFEALARWKHAELGFIPPDVFLPHIESHGLTQEMTRVVISQAAEFLGELPADLTMAVNVPMKVCSEASFPDFLNMVLARNHLTAANLTVEVTEAGPLEISQMQIDALTRLRMHGFCLSIDDFGTGVSSLERLVRIPFNELKIDRYFVREISTSAAAEKLVRNLVRIAKAMDMSVTIEGVEDAATLQIAERIGCEFAQGYLIARPMPASKALEWMSQWVPR